MCCFRRKVVEVHFISVLFFREKQALTASLQRRRATNCGKTAIEVWFFGRIDHSQMHKKHWHSTFGFFSCESRVWSLGVAAVMVSCGESNTAAKQIVDNIRPLH
jgi:hypothetical protein